MSAGPALRCLRRPFCLPQAIFQQFLGPSRSGQLSQGQPCDRSFSFAASNAGAERQLRVRHILVRPDQEDLLRDIEAQLKGGAEWTALAAQYSTCPSGRRGGGDLGWMAQSRMSFASAAGEASVGARGRAESDRGLHLLEVVDERNVKEVVQMSVEDLSEVLEDGNAVEGAQFIDVREPHEEEIASLPRFHLMPLSRFEQWAPRVKELLNPSSYTFVLCHHGRRSQRAAEFLSRQGFEAVANIVGGIEEYSLRVDPSVPRY